MRKLRSIPGVIFRAFFGGPHGVFSSKKFWAFCFCSLSLYDNIELLFFPMQSWVVALDNASVSDAVIITVKASVDALAWGALAIYGWTKKHDQAGQLPQTAQ